MKKEAAPQMDDLFPKSPEDDFGDYEVKYEIGHGAILDRLRDIFNHALISVMPKCTISNPSQIESSPIEDLDALSFEQTQALQDKLTERFISKGYLFVRYYDTCLYLRSDNLNKVFAEPFVTSVSMYGRTSPLPFKSAFQVTSMKFYKSRLVL
ncbi:MAG: hypothetical protein WC806_01885 [Candidatus Gracilibacteria bacterium]|jgi:hypothetical protein